MITHDYYAVVTHSSSAVIHYATACRTKQEAIGEIRHIKQNRMIAGWGARGTAELGYTFFTPDGLYEQAMIERRQRGCLWCGNYCGYDNCGVCVGDMPCGECRRKHNVGW